MRTSTAARLFSRISWTSADDLLTCPIEAGRARRYVNHDDTTLPYLRPSVRAVGRRVGQGRDVVALDGWTPNATYDDRVVLDAAAMSRRCVGASIGPSVGVIRAASRNTRIGSVAYLGFKGRAPISGTKNATARSSDRAPMAVVGHRGSAR